MEDKQGKVQMRQINPIPFFSCIFLSFYSCLASQSKKQKLMFTVMVSDMIIILAIKINIE